VRFALVTTQIALTLALLGGSALLLRSLWNVVRVPLGFDAEQVITLTAGLSRTRYPTAEHATAFFAELVARARATPGAISVAVSDSAPPPRPPGGRAPITVEGRPIVPKAPQILIGLRWVTPQYFETFRIPIVKGTTLKDDETGEPTVVLNESAERILFAGQSAVGRRVRPAPFGFSNGKEVPNPWFTVVGVTPDVRNGQSLTDDPAPEAFLAVQAGTPGPALGVSRLTLRTTAAPSDAAAFLRQITADLDPRQLVTIQTGNELLTTLTARPRFIASLLTAFAGLALLLAASGLYSVASYLVTQRRRDIGVRMAIGASPRDVARQVVGEAGRWVIGGAVAGAALGWIGTRALQSQLYQVESLDPWSWTGALLALAVVLVMAVFRPAYRAAHVDPVAALRAD
jgi:predicted permease